MLVYIKRLFKIYLSNLIYIYLKHKQFCIKRSVSQANQWEKDEGNYHELRIVPPRFSRYDVATDLNRQMDDQCGNLRQTT